MNLFTVFMILFFAFMVSISIRFLITDARETKKVREANNNIYIASRKK